MALKTKKNRTGFNISRSELLKFNNEQNILPKIMNDMTSFLHTLLPAIVILGLGLAGLAITMLVRKNGRFPNTHIHGNRHLQKNDIHCVQKEDQEEQQKAAEKDKFRNLTYRKE